VHGVEDQKKIAGEMEKLGLTMGVFTAFGAFEEPSFVKDTPEIRQMLGD